MEAYKRVTLWGVYKHAMMIGIIAGVLLLVIILFSGILLPLSIRNFMDFFFMLVPALVAMSVGILAVKNARSVLPGLIDAVIISGLAGAVAGFIMGILFMIVDAIFNYQDMLLSLLFGFIIIFIYILLMGIIAAIFGTFYTIIILRIKKL